MLYIENFITGFTINYIISNLDKNTILLLGLIWPIYIYIYICVCVCVCVCVCDYYLHVMVDGKGMLPFQTRVDIHSMTPVMSSKDTSNNQLQI